MSEIVAGMFQSFDGVMELPDYYHHRSFLFHQPFGQTGEGCGNNSSIGSPVAPAKSLRDEPHIGQAVHHLPTTYQWLRQLRAERMVTYAHEIKWGTSGAALTRLRAAFATRSSH